MTSTGRGLTAEQRESIPIEYAAGASSRALGDKYGCSPKNILYWIGKAGIKPHPRGRQARPSLLPKEIAAPAFDVPDLSKSTVLGATFTGTHEVPCRHKKKRRKKDAKKGRPHGKTHIVTDLIAYSGGPFKVGDQEIVPNGGDITINWDEKGIMKL
jgi:hypothetical protein